MLTDGNSVSVATGLTTNAFLGRPVEFLGVAAVMRLLTIMDPTAATTGTQQLLMNVGPDQRAPMAAGTPVAQAPLASQGPRDDEDTVLPQVAIPAGARLALNFTTAGTGPGVYRYRAIIV